MLYEVITLALAGMALPFPPGKPEEARGSFVPVRERPRGIIGRSRLEVRVSYLRGMVVQLNTGLGKHSGTDDPIYVGAAGTGGGREFPLDVKWHDDFERRSRVKYLLGA